MSVFEWRPKAYIATSAFLRRKSTNSERHVLKNPRQRLRVGLDVHRGGVDAGVARDLGDGHQVYAPAPTCGRPGALRTARFVFKGVL